MKLKMPESTSILPGIDGQNSSLKTGNNYVWRDEKASFVVKSTSGVNNPSFEEYIPGFQGLVFSGTIMNQVWVDFHIDHDYAIGTKIYPHVHWMPLTNGEGMVRWGFQYVIAKGHGQSAFPLTSNTIYVNHDFPANSIYKHMVTEVTEAQAIQSTEIEPDTVIKMRIFRDAAVDTYNSNVHSWGADLHIQVARLGTKNRAPDFFI